MWFLSSVKRCAQPFCHTILCTYDDEFELLFNDAQVNAVILIMKKKMGYKLWVTQLITMSASRYRSSHFWLYKGEWRSLLQLYFTTEGNGTNFQLHSHYFYSSWHFYPFYNSFRAGVVALSFHKVTTSRNTRPHLPALSASVRTQCKNIVVTTLMTLRSDNPVKRTELYKRL